MFEHVIDDHLSLTRLEIEDAHAIHALVDQNRDHLRRWLPWVDRNRSVEDSRRFIQDRLEAHVRTGDQACAIRWGGEIVGVIDFYGLKRAMRSVSLGYWLAQARQGQGIMSRAVLAMVGIAFEELGLNRVEIRVAVGNERSENVVRRLGFEHEGTLREAEWLYDHFVDHNVFAMLRRDFGVAP